MSLLCISRIHIDICIQIPSSKFRLCCQSWVGETQLSFNSILLKFNLLKIYQMASVHNRSSIHKPTPNTPNITTQTHIWLPFIIIKRYPTSNLECMCSPLNKAGVKYASQHMSSSGPSSASLLGTQT